MSTTTPQTRGPAEIVEKIRRARIADADAAHTEFPQYAGHWDDWRLVEVIHDVRGKSGRVCFLAGDLVLCSPQTFTERVAPRRRRPVEYRDWPVRTFVTCYSYRTGCDTALRAEKVRDVLVTKPEPPAA